MYLLSALLIGGAAAAFSGCSQPVAGGVTTLGAETQRALVGYEKTTYVYPVQVPGTNRYVEMRTKEPLNSEPTYEDYLEWKKRN